MRERDGTSKSDKEVGGGRRWWGARKLRGEGGGAKQGGRAIGERGKMRRSRMGGKGGRMI